MELMIQKIAMTKRRCFTCGRYFLTESELDRIDHRCPRRACEWIDELIHENLTLNRRVRSLRAYIKHMRKEKP